MDNVIFNLSHGMYALTTNGGGCIVDAVCQISSGSNPLVSIAINKLNNTNKLMHKNNLCCLSIIGKNTDSSVIYEFGFNSMRNYNKFEYNKLIDVDGLYAVKDSIGYVILEKVDTIENDTHTLFICRVLSDKRLNDDKEITYNYYREHKNELIKTKTESGKTAWICTICGYVYYGEQLPEDYRCPQCGVDKFLFKKE